MALGPALLYFAIAYFVVPHNRSEVPFKQFGLDTTMLFKILGEVGFYEASVFEVYKSIVCSIDNDYGSSMGYCAKQETGAFETTKMFANFL